MGVSGAGDPVVPAYGGVVEGSVVESAGGATSVAIPQGGAGNGSSGVGAALGSGAEGAGGAGSAVGGAGSGAGGVGMSAAEVDGLARRLYEPIARRLRAELWVDRERTGTLMDRMW
ncbi:hypothetical protein GCM10022235_60590 [Kribbella ginsengisoli]|uniref:Uncharacterized protein n=1 Tax=Kribbella ginsengisoli TaxID=363865 RepID=A0ABP6YGT4_9ACTN